MNNNICGSIYILTNPSFPEYVKIGYADDVERRLRELNRSECTPFAFRLYAYYEVTARLSDIKLHEMIDKLNPNLRSIDDIEGKKRIREFYTMEAEEAYAILESIATINGLQSRLHKVKLTKEEELEKEIAEQNRELSKNRHHFKNITFTSSLTNKTYYSETKDDGTLGIYEKDTDNEIPNNSNPSKKQIVLQAVKDLDGVVDGNLSLYQLQHRLEKIILNNNSLHFD